MRFTIFQESRKGSREGQPGPHRATRTAATRCCWSSPTAWAGTRAARSPRRSPCGCSSSASSRRRKPVLRNPLKFLQETMLRAHAALGSYANQFSMLETPRTTCVACIVQASHAYWAHAGDSRFYLFRQGSADRRDQGPLEGAVPGRPGLISAPTRSRASGPQQDLQLPRRPGRPGDRPVAAHAAAQRRRHGALHRRPVERDAAERDGDAGSRRRRSSRRRPKMMRRGRAARRLRRRQPVGDRRALGPGDAHRRDVDAPSPRRSASASSQTRDRPHDDAHRAHAGRSAT